MLCQRDLEYAQLSLPITEMIADCELSLLMGPCMTKEQMEYVVECVNEFMENIG